MTLVRPSKPLSKINFRLRLQIHTPFYQRNIRKHSCRLNPLAPVHLSVCTIHPWPRVSLLVCKYSAFFFSLRHGNVFAFFSFYAPLNKPFFFVYFYMISSCFSHFALFPQCSMSFQQRGTGWIFSSPNRLFLDINNESWVDDETSQSMERSRPMKIFKRS